MMEEEEDEDDDCVDDMMTFHQLIWSSNWPAQDIRCVAMLVPPGSSPDQ